MNYAKSAILECQCSMLNVWVTASIYK